MTGLLKATASHTANAIHSLPVISWARRKTLRATSAPIKHMKTMVAGHHSLNHEPITQAGTSIRGRPARCEAYISVGGRAIELATCAHNGSGATMPT